MHTIELTPAVLEDLRRPRRYPAVSLLMATHRREPDNAQDPIRLRNLLAEAKKRIAADPEVSRESRIDLERQLDQAASQVDLVHAEDGLLILVAAGEHQVWQFAAPTAPPERVLLESTFLTRNLIAARQYRRPYWVLTLSLQAARLWEGTEDAFAPVTGHGFPVEPEIPDPQDAIPGPNFGNRPSSKRDERVRQYLRSVDSALGKALAAERRPVFVVGAIGDVTRFEEESDHQVDVAGRLDHGGLDQVTGHQLAELLRPTFAAHAKARTAWALDRLDAARGQRLFAGGVDEVRQMVRAGRVALLLVEEHLQVSAEAVGEHLVVPSGGTTRATVDDVVDSIVEAAADSGAEVRFVPDDTLSDDGRIAAALRY
ncbi:hypothetical protein ABIA33_000219 [Streptacidiphilus sp. MAP12-16]|uniref:baeRF3 domain-containing protein n=1 Tax=Streptacidiphilus sp. MAP12-16 TaxID=3156300 RepID=UPI0035197677